MNDKRISITIDDLPFVSKGVTLDEIEEATSRTQYHLGKGGIRAVAFVVGQEIFGGNEDDRRLHMVKSWQDQGHLLGNHTFSHLSLDKVPLEDFIEDVEKNERVLEAFWSAAPYDERYFRFPYLQRGTTEKSEGIKAFLSQRPYTVAPVSVNSLDFIFNTVYVYAYKNKEKSAVRHVVSAYLSYLDALIKYRERLVLDKIGRAIGHILLLHANLINSYCLDKVLAVLRENGYCFPSLQQTLSDPYYKDFSQWGEDDRHHYRKWWNKKGEPNKIEPPPGVDPAVLEAYCKILRL